MKKIIEFLMTLISAVLLSISAVSYKKVDVISIPFPQRLMEAFRDTTIEQIEWYLAAAREWHFHKSFGITSAQAQVEDYSKPYVKITVLSQGFFNTGTKYERNQIINSSAEIIEINVYRRRKIIRQGHNTNMLFSSITIKLSEEFYIRFDEYSDSVERDLTIAAMEAAATLFCSRAEQENELLHDGSISNMQETLSIVENVYGGHDISGYIHLSKKNLCRIKITDAKTQEVYYDQLTDAHCQFYVGWSDEENQYFYFFQDLTIKQKPDGPESADVLVQLWVEDEDGSRCVLETRANITFWVR